MKEGRTLHHAGAHGPTFGVARQVRLVAMASTMISTILRIYTTRDAEPSGFRCARRTAPSRKPHDRSRRLTSATTQSRATRAIRTGLPASRSTTTSTAEDIDCVFCDSHGRPLRKSNLMRRSFHPLLKKAGLPRIRFHDLRHTAATPLFASGVHPKGRGGHRATGLQPLPTRPWLDFEQGRWANFIPMEVIGEFPPNRALGVRYQRGHCPECRSPRVLKIEYGLPGPGTIPKWEEEGIFPGGCLIGGATRRCADCGHEWGGRKPRTDPMDGPPPDRAPRPSSKPEARSSPVVAFALLVLVVAVVVLLAVAL